MKIKIYKYPTWFGVYQLVDLFIKDEKKAGKIADKIEEKIPQLNELFKWLYDKRVRKDKIEVEAFDTWNADYTLAKIIVPVLKQFKDTTHGAPNTDNEDVPKNLRSDELEDGSVSPTHFEKWDWILNEMIWAFEWSLIKDDSIQEMSPEEYDKNKDRANNGRRLFAKYYQGLWD